MEIRKTTFEDLDQVMEIYARARVFMAEHWKVKNSKNLPNLDCVSKNCLSQSHKYFSQNFYNLFLCNL